ncbi:hypothetical protein Acr_13g0000080 [Actinidia rufa]|uniref:Uncharacterized protein n=1 Tax=Actinidia rufa TaxID=165716 RepID=A0A7J0FKZ5_9ERIC|nr:hypothetical protein Acr_13g0000080 [Actinidia rufa]
MAVVSNPKSLFQTTLNSDLKPVSLSHDSRPPGHCSLSDRSLTCEEVLRLVDDDLPFLRDPSTTRKYSEATALTTDFQNFSSESPTSFHSYLVRPDFG